MISIIIIKGFQQISVIPCIVGFEELGVAESFDLLKDLVGRVSYRMWEEEWDIWLGNIIQTIMGLLVCGVYAVGEEALN